MAERKHTIICMFDLKSPRISAFDIHEWLYEQLHIDENTLTMIQIDGIKRHVYLKFVDDKHATDIIQASNGQLEYRHVTGEISIVKLEMAGNGAKRIRIANLPPETSDRTIKTALAPYGEIESIQDEVWSKAYRYTVKTGVKIAMTKLKAHLPSQIVIGGQRALISYEGQPVTCYICGEQGHIQQQCTKRRKDNKDTERTQTPSWARILQQGPKNREDTEQNRDRSHQTESTMEQQEQRQNKTEIEGPPKVTHAQDTRNGKQQQHGALPDTQFASDVTPQAHNTDATENTSNTSTETEDGTKYTDKQGTQDWYQQMRQEEEEEEQHMIVEDNMTGNDVTKEQAPDRENRKATGESRSEMKEENNTSKPKKLKLGTGNERRTERQRSRTRQTTIKKE